MARRTHSFSERHGATLVAVVLVAAGTAHTLVAQAPVSRNFEANAPAIGEMMPDVVVHSRDGAELRLRDLLKERHTVLILGCLT